MPHLIAKSELDHRLKANHVRTDIALATLSVEKPKTASVI